jgi:hypothetical protein
LTLLAVVPAKDALQVGAEAKLDFPNAGTRAAKANDVIYGATITSKVTATAPVKLSLSGTVGVVDNAGGRQVLGELFGDQPLPSAADMHRALHDGSPYLVGNATFDEQKGELIGLDVFYVPLPLKVIDASTIPSSHDAVHVVIARTP